MGGFIRGLVKLSLGIAVVGGGVVGVLRYGFVDVTTVEHNGMAPTLEQGDEILVWRDAVPDRGDVVICRHPAGASEVIGRVVAVGGQTVSSERGQLRIDGQPLRTNWEGTETFVQSAQTLRMRRGRSETGNSKHAVYLRAGAAVEVPTTPVPPGTLFLLGDNRSFASRDSRSFGPVVAATCRGDLFMRWKPSETSPNRLGSRLDIIH